MARREDLMEALDAIETMQKIYTDTVWAGWWFCRMEG